MRYFSTNRQAPPVDLRQAVLSGLAPDRGLYLPETVSPMPSEFWAECRNYSFVETAQRLAANLLGADLPEPDLQDIVSNAFTFEAPLVKLRGGVYTLELFHGPTLAFKDFAACFMAQLVSYYMRGSSRDLTILVATSGDTGSAVAHGFLQAPGIKVVILYPHGKVSKIQEQQLTTAGHNVTALEVSGSFDDCQQLVKAAFGDGDLQAALLLSSANSINIARLIPQSFYFVQAYAQVADPALPLIFSVPSGNFGNLTGGLLASRLGLPVSKFVAATNVNRIVPDYLENGRYTPKPSIETISNAMDVGNPSNFARIAELYGKSVSAMRQDIAGYSFDDQQTRQAIRRVFEDYNYTLDPHGAVAFLGLEQYLQAVGGENNGIFLETAHPAKFGEVVAEETGRPVELPERLRACLALEKKAVAISHRFADFKEWLLAA